LASLSSSSSSVSGSSALFSLSQSLILQNLLLFRLPPHFGPPAAPISPYCTHHPPSPFPGLPEPGIILGGG
ncbi:MAG: hypothetical protein WBK88_05515, partial [Methanothrix sp.]